MENIEENRNKFPAYYNQSKVISHPSKPNWTSEHGGQVLVGLVDS